MPQAAVGGLQNTLVGARSLTSQQEFSDWVMQDVSHRGMIHSPHLLSFSRILALLTLLSNFQRRLTFPS